MGIGRLLDSIYVHISAKKKKDFKEWSCMETEKLGAAHPAFRFFKKIFGLLPWQLTEIKSYAILSKTSLTEAGFYLIIG